MIISMFTVSSNYSGQLRNKIRKNYFKKTFTIVKKSSFLWEKKAKTKERLNISCNLTINCSITHGITVATSSNITQFIVWPNEIPLVYILDRKTCIRHQ